MTLQEIKSILRRLPPGNPYFGWGSRGQHHRIPTASAIELHGLALRDPAFGANLASSYAAAHLPLPDFVEQPALRRANRFLLEPDQLDLNVALAFASNLPESQPQRDLFRALLICRGASIESVAALCRVDPDMLQLFETLFWNVLDRKAERLFLARICGQLGPRRTPGNQNALGELGPELVRIAYQDGRTELVLAATGVAPSMPLSSAPVLYQQLRRGYLVSAAKALRSQAISDDENPALKPALRIIAAARMEEPSQPAAQGPTLDESCRSILDALMKVQSPQLSGKRRPQGEDACQ